MTITLAPLPREALDRVAHFSLPPEKLQYSALPAETMESLPETREGHVIEENGNAVGFFAIDTDYPAEHEFAPKSTIGLRMFLIDESVSGRGVASAACALLRDYLARQYPSADAVYLTVNHRNPAARKAYLNGGFTDTGTDYLGGSLGPQHILMLRLRD